MEFTTRLGLQSQATRLLGEALLPNVNDRYGPGTLYGSWPRSRGTWIANIRQDNEPSQTPHFPRAKRKCPAGFGAGLLPFRSPLLRESWLVSFPPPINMLKFGG